MIKITIGTDGKKVYDEVCDENCTLKEVSLVLLKLKKIEQELIDMEFESDWEISEGDEE